MKFFVYLLEIFLEYFKCCGENEGKKQRREEATKGRSNEGKKQRREEATKGYVLESNQVSSRNLSIPFYVKQNILSILWTWQSL